MSILINLKEGKNLGIEVTSGPIVSSVSLLGGAVYAPTYCLCSAVKKSAAEVMR